MLARVKRVTGSVATGTHILIFFVKGLVTVSGYCHHSHAVLIDVFIEDGYLKRPFADFF